MTTPSKDEASVGGTGLSNLPSCYRRSTTIAVASTYEAFDTRMDFADEECQA